MVQAKFQASALALSLLVATATMATLATPSVAAAADERPLLMEGKTTLYQRVLSTPDCKLLPLDGAGAGIFVPAFSQYYVYADEESRYKVGTNATGKVVGYLDKSCVVPWKQQLAMLFTNPANRNRALIFEQESTLDRIIDQDDGEQYYQQLYQQVEEQGHAEGVISIEPKEYVDYQKNFYLLPILQSEESMFPDGSYVYKHEIASITDKNAKSASTSIEQGKTTVGEAQGAQLGAGAAGSNTDGSDVDSAIVGFKTAIVFVIDSSISMQPYIDRTKQAINTIYKDIEATHLNDSVQFGIVSFRADVRQVPGLEYTTRMFLRPGEATSAQEFNAKVAQLKQATVSSAKFDEDSYAGINMALQDINWQQYGGRYIVLITDAGALDADDPQSSTGLDANALRLEAEHYGVAVYTLHLRTKIGKNNHQKASEQYEELSYNSILKKPLYYPVNAGSVSDFGQMVDKLSQSLTTQVVLATQGKLSAGSALGASNNVTITAPKTVEEQTQVIESDSARLGLAMQLAYLGRVKGTKTPSFMQGWISERDVMDHNQLVCTPVVLVNRNQLSDLYTLVKGVLEAGIAGQLSSDDMFSQLQAMAAQMGRDPNMLKESQTLSDMGITAELLDDLPYKSRIASITPEDWYNLGSQEQENIVRGLENSLNYIQYCSSDSDRFIKLNEDADASEEVYPIPLDALP
ncbi:MAG TPA: VWA domain-containing protein [Candidatus Anaerobiospirillum pullistercoris]|uniref:VWA domain-containing protein n=1 Tax=Candidatus Anaerobiospirillum pullistercoris TaxID=2838452 RepID=A0A9D2B1K8_9GAMM|nr:VWA domain-containing protein [Candidatus Anaerobiospirillum pullistercoris]